MTSARFFARRAAQLVWLLPLGLAGLVTACGSSPSMIGTSAGAAGASAGNAGSSSATGGSGSGHAGAGATTAGGSSELGGASTGGSTSSGGSTSTSGGAGGGSEVGACSADKDCAAGYNCLYKIADGCTAKGSCFKMPGGALCASLSSYCGCLGQMVGVPCYDPTGYSPAPVVSQKSSAACPAAVDPRCAGKSCGAQCSNGEFPAACAPDGNCMVLFDASECP